MTDPKVPCKSCGGGWKPQSRREFIQKAVVLGAGLALSATALTAPTAAHAAAFDLTDCLVANNDRYELCLSNANNIPGNSVIAKAKRLAARAACEIDRADGVAVCYEEMAAEVAKELGQHIIDHPGEVTVGTVIVIIGIAILVTAAGVVIL